MGIEQQGGDDERENLLIEYARWAADKLAGDTDGTQQGMIKVWNIITFAGVRKGLGLIVDAQDKREGGE